MVSGIKLDSADAYEGLWDLKYLQAKQIQKNIYYFDSIKTINYKISLKFPQKILILRDNL